MWCMGEHVNWLNLSYLIVCVHRLKVACLCGRVARYVNYSVWCSIQYCFYYVGVHTSTWRVGDDNVGAAVFCYELISQNILHVTRKEQSVLNTVNL